MNYSSSKLFEKQWADFDDDDNAIITTNPQGQRIVLTFFNDVNGDRMKCERIFDVIESKSCVLKKSVNRMKQWKKFGIESLNKDSEKYAKYRTIPFENDEVILPGVVRGVAVVDNESSVYGEIEAPEVSKRLMSDLTKLMQGAISKHPRDIYTNFVLPENKEDDLAFVSDRYSNRYMDDEKTIRVSDIPEYVTEEELHGIFSRIGDIKRLFLIVNKDTLISRGLAFITYHEVSKAAAAIESFNGKGICGALVKVDWSKK